MRKNILGGAFFLLLGVFLWITIPISIPHDDQLTKSGPRLFPTFLSIALAGFSLILILQSFMQRRHPAEREAAERGPEEVITLADEAKVGALFLIMTGSCLVFTLLGYLIAMPLGVSAMLLLYKEKKWQSYAILYFFIVLFYFIFVKLMYVQL